MNPRITTEPGFLDLVDTLNRGGTAEWRALYGRARASVQVRQELRRALSLIEPELESTRAIWSHLLSTLEETTQDAER